MPRFCVVSLAIASLGFATGCARAPVESSIASDPSAKEIGTVRLSDAEQVREADISILFIGNSHTSGHNLPELVAQLIRFQNPNTTVYTYRISVAFLEDVARIPACREEIESRPWTHVVLQAQKISVSGKFEYSRQEGIDFAKLAKDRGATVIFYPEWGLRGVPGDGLKQETVYREMAEQAGVGVAPVPTAWDLAIDANPELPLHASDGNHQTELGAFLTACVLTGKITKQDPTTLGEYPDPRVDATVRQFLAKVAACALTETQPTQNTP